MTNWKTSVAGIVFAIASFMAASSDFNPETRKWAQLVAIGSGAAIGVTAADSKKKQ